MIRLTGLTALAAIFFVGSVAVADEALDGFEIAVDKSGAIRVPDVDYRADWTMLGTFSVAGEEGADGLHVVYAQPGAAQAYRKDGVFPDGTVLIKELLGTKTEELTTGTVSYAAETSGWFVMVKNANDRFDDNPLWGDGWGWAYFDKDDRNTSPTEDYVAECKACHVPAQATDWVYVRGYPALKSK